MRELRVKNASISTWFDVRQNHNIKVEIRNNKDLKGIAVWLSGTKVFDADFNGEKHVINFIIDPENMSNFDKNNVEFKGKEYQ